MKIVLIVLSVIGLLKLVSLFICLLIQVYYKIRKINFMEFHKDYSFCITDMFYLTPSITIDNCGQYFSICFCWLYFEYYEATKFELDVDEEL